MALTKQLKGKLVNVDNNTQIMGYASGHNAQNYLQYLCDGLYYEELCTEQKKANVHPPSTSPSTLETTLPEGITDETPIDAVEEMLEHVKAGVAVLDGSNVRGLEQFLATDPLKGDDVVCIPVHSPSSNPLKVGH